MNDSINAFFSRRLLFYCTALAMAVYIIWRVFFTLPFGYGVVSITVSILLLISEIIATMEALEQYRHMGRHTVPELPTIPDSWYPDVDVFIATHNESTDILFKTVNACTFMDYPDKSKIHIYICDDNNRPEMAELARELGVNHIGISGNTQAKAGNLNNALSETKSPLVATFDADMIPTRDFLTAVVPYFFLPKLKKCDGKWVEKSASEIDPDYKIGFIQTPQSFYNPDLFQYNLYAENRIPNEQDYFFREINVSRNDANAPIYAGSNTVISREALKAVGGIATGTITEDFETGLNIQRHGYTTFAIPRVLAHGLAPSTIRDLINQRERWGRGCIQSLHRINILFSKDLSFSAKLSYIACYFYWWTFLRRLVYLLCPILFTLFHLHIVECDMWQVMAFWLPAYFLYTIVLRKTSNNIRNMHWSNVIDTIMFPFLILPICAEALGIKKEKFVVTKKDRVTNDQTTSIVQALPHILLLCASIIALMFCIHDTLQDAAAYNAIIMYWLVINIKNLILAVFFMCGRENFRQSERFYVKTPITLDLRGTEIKGSTLDISETGMSVIMGKPEYIPPDEDTLLTISNGTYSASMMVTVVHVEMRKERDWKYSFAITDIDYDQQRKYTQIIYDRHHSLPDYLDRSVSIFDDYSLNVRRRIDNQLNVQRRLPRIQLNVPITFTSGESAVICSFNYWYFGIGNPLKDSIDDKDNMPVSEFALPSELYFEASEDMTFHLVSEDELSTSAMLIYRLKNRTDIMQQAEYASLIDQWMAQSEPKST